MSFETDIATAALRRDLALDLRAGYLKAREGSKRWQELDALHAREHARLLRAATPQEATDIARSAIAEIEAIAAADLADWQRELTDRRKLAEDARHFELRRQQRLAWAQRVGAPTITAINRVVERLEEARRGITGRSESEADIRAHLTDIGDALRSMAATIALESSASIARETAAEKAAAA
ncbi:hypothetical protein CWB41_15905 [Methylovirgula ligni]|uniref:Uncharacterized protein n=1 Tax=Methylovirgula ligni TaxID=569860 RepID=A0A3D9YYQ5_9HYPH|nr:hypothetical protein [Methylovirgula ligni]QAY97037.1 hypothetical protein CWB41_15905 [Methylovirgula ligni]REF87894.1 hypothetical protein DES32_1531 [Methylovirgula ligni]